MTESGDGAADASGRPHEEVGSLGDEAAKLLGALSDWARDQDPGNGSSADADADADAGAGATAGAGAARRAAAAVGDLARDVDRHLATGEPACTWCPVCRTVHLVRATSPEVRAHLTTAATSLLQAGLGLLAAASTAPTEADGRSTRSPRSTGPERIDLDEPDVRDVPDVPDVPGDPT